MPHILIPVRVAATAPVHVVRDDCRVEAGHPLHQAPCPVCGNPFEEDQPLSLVYVGVEPDLRKARGYMTGAAVAVHTTCASPAEQPPALPPQGDCLFCDPTAHEVIGESATLYIRMDGFPAAPGHVEIVTKRHVPSVFDLSANEAAELHGMRLQARALVEARLGHAPDGWTIGTNEGEAAGRSIAHVHEHLIPRYHGDVPDPRGGIRQCAPNCDPDAWASAAGGAERATP